MVFAKKSLLVMLIKFASLMLIYVRTFVNLKCLERYKGEYQSKDIFLNLLVMFQIRSGEFLLRIY